MLFSVAAQQSSSGGSGSGLIGLIIGIVAIAGMWKVFTKAGQPGWAAIIPIYNAIVLLRIVGKPWWWFVLLLIPIVNIVVAVIVMIQLAKAFGKGVGFGIGLLLLSFIFMPLLGFGDARYLGPNGAEEGSARVYSPTQV